MYGTMKNKKRHMKSRRKDKRLMAKKKGVSSKTQTKKQLDDYANQNNPNNKAYKARVANDKNTKKYSRKNELKRQTKQWPKFEKENGVMYPLDWMYYSNPYDFD